MSKYYATFNLLLQVWCSSTYRAFQTPLLELGIILSLKRFFKATIISFDSSDQVQSNSRVMSNIFTQWAVIMPRSIHCSRCVARALLKHLKLNFLNVAYFLLIRHFWKLELIRTTLPVKGYLIHGSWAKISINEQVLCRIQYIPACVLIKYF